MWRGCYLLSYNEPAAASSCGSAGSTTHCIRWSLRKRFLIYLVGRIGELTRASGLLHRSTTFFIHSWFMDDYSMWIAAKCWAACKCALDLRRCEKFSLNKQNFITAAIDSSSRPISLHQSIVNLFFLLSTIHKMFNLRLNFTHLFRLVVAGLRS